MLLQVRGVDEIGFGAVEQPQDERGGQQHDDQDVADDRDRLGEQAGPVTAAELQALAQLPFDPRAQDDADDQQHRQPKRRISSPSRPNTSSSARSSACTFTAGVPPAWRRTGCPRTGRRAGCAAAAPRGRQREVEDAAGVAEIEAGDQRPDSSRAPSRRAAGRADPVAHERRRITAAAGADVGNPSEAAAPGRRRRRRCWPPPARPPPRSRLSCRTPRCAWRSSSRPTYDRNVGSLGAACRQARRTESPTRCRGATAATIDRSPCGSSTCRPTGSHRGPAGTRATHSASPTAKTPLRTSRRRCRRPSTGSPSVKRCCPVGQPVDADEADRSPSCRRRRRAPAAGAQHR